MPPGPPGFPERMQQAKRLVDAHSIPSAKALEIATDHLRHAVERALPDADGVVHLRDWLSGFEALRYSLDRAQASGCHLVAFFAQATYLRMLAELPGPPIKVVETMLADLPWVTSGPLAAPEPAPRPPVTDREGAALLAAVISAVDPRLSRRSSSEEIIRSVEALHADRKELSRVRSALVEEHARSLSAASATRTLNEQKRGADEQINRLKRLVVYVSVAGFLGVALVAASAAMHLVRW